MTLFKPTMTDKSKRYKESDRISKRSFLSGLAKTRKSFSANLAALFKSSPKIDENLFEEIEDQLIIGDIGVSTSRTIVSLLKKEMARRNTAEPSQLLDCLRQSMITSLMDSNGNTALGYPIKPHVILMIGVNGVGKTTTLAKIAHRHNENGQKVMMAACDTFRAAAIEQLQSWGERLDVPVIAQTHGADAAAVAFDAYSAACAREIDVLLIDTAGRQHTKGDLMEQLKKINRVLQKAKADLPHEILLTVDAGNGQNVHSQIDHFSNAVGVSGLCMTKLDGTAKGGIVLSVAERFKVPVKYIGIGEGLDDLKPFDPKEFVDALLSDLSEINR